MAGKTVRKNRPEIKLNSYEDLFGEASAHADVTEVMIKELHDILSGEYDEGDGTGYFRRLR